MDNNELSEIVFELNGKLPEGLLSRRGDCSFQIHSDGFSSIITFGDIYMWGDSDDERPWDEETDDYAISVRNYIVQEFDSIISALMLVNLSEEE